jgi:hypothetical protein
MPRGCAGNAVFRIPGCEVLVGAKRKLPKPSLGEALADPANQRNDDFPIDLRVDFERTGCFQD